MVLVAMPVNWEELAFPFPSTQSARTSIPIVPVASSYQGGITVTPSSLHSVEPAACSRVLERLQFSLVTMDAGACEVSQKIADFT